MMSFVRMEKYLSIVCDNCKTIACGKHWIHQRNQTHIKRYGPSLFGTGHRDFNLIAPGVLRNDRIQRKLMVAKLVEAFFTNVVEISSTRDVDVLGVVILDAPLRFLHASLINPGSRVEVVISCARRSQDRGQYVRFVRSTLLIDISLFSVDAEFFAFL